MRFFRIIGSAFCLFSIVIICLLAASVFNEELSGRLKDMGTNTLSAISEFSEKATENAFAEENK